MAKKETDLYNRLIEDLPGVNLSYKGLSKPDPKLEQQVTNIFAQAYEHRNKLLRFYIWYTIVFTLFVLGLIGWQAYVRVMQQNSHFEIIPQWGLNLLVTGMFAQFVGLLTIVTKRVWDYEHFLAYHSRMFGNTIEARGAGQDTTNT